MSVDAERIHVALDMFKLYENTERRDEMYDRLKATVDSVRERSPRCACGAVPMHGSEACRACWQTWWTKAKGQAR